MASGVMSPLIPSGQQIHIAHGRDEATVVSVGGGIRSYQVAGQDVLDGYGPDEMCSSARGQPLIPWPNRLAEGAYAFRGQNYQLALSEPEFHNAIHGLVRYSNWSVLEQGREHVEVNHRLHPQPGYPFLVDLRIVYRLDSGGLSVRTEATNRGSEPCPIGFGAHPYLRLGTGQIDSLELQSPAAT
ncbi:MAG TPA: hypothetical protein VKT80_02730 [Chloroflexota bacterium]|nr:hypothetical protein [Chloroflexota bacterium]